MDETRFADSGLAAQQDRPRRAFSDGVPSLRQKGRFLLSADEGRQAGGGFQAVSGAAHPEGPATGNRSGDARQGALSEGGAVEVALHHLARRRAEENLAVPGQMAQADRRSRRQAEDVWKL